MPAASVGGGKVVRHAEIARLLVLCGIAVLSGGCASHRPATCQTPAKVVGADPGGYRGGWVLIRRDLDAEDTAARIAKTYHVRTQALAYVHGFSIFPMPQEQSFLCEKAVIEVHYDPTEGAAVR